VTRRKAPAPRCTWRDCAQPAAATVAFELPNLLAGSRRNYCATHTTQVFMAQGTVLVAHFGPPPAVRKSTPGRAGQARTRRKGVMP
jgi:hypothetical protein